MSILSQIVLAIGVLLLLTAGAAFIVMSVRNARRFPAYPAPHAMTGRVFTVCLIAGLILTSASRSLNPD